ncbi:hypothetical protein [Rhizobium tubonense]|uniref:Uncharacterized protein n=1 Tax=Rhizobium tubonense TaxID=484088 RepID=A0A2W4C3B5_9HYPH|nr:hypothetical protein [Rhizobium tubonense]PZM07987.1 hypothetical protein CPY51_30010 [Rhizobium tubonense]
MNTMKREAGSILSKVVSTACFNTAVILSISGVFTSAALAAETCEGLQSAVKANGKYVYHYKDPKRPNFDLYKEYVKFENQCNTGNQLTPKLVPGLENCYMPTCVDGEGRDQS